jgi:hydrogenase maturation protein HypF
MQKTNTTFHIHLSGLVQGVGFRPHVYQLAREWKLTGWVNNSLDGVHIRFQAAPETARRFFDHLVAHPPRLARITSQSFFQVNDSESFDSFQIIHSATAGIPRILLSPDLGMCDDCRQDVRDPGGRRHNYAFTTCTHCGPRYTIMESLPYDRERTSMQAFPQCPICKAEYDDPDDRRYFSQTNSCPTCGIQLSWLEPTGAIPLEAADVMDRAVEWLQNEKILAVKGIGGYLLVCDATASKVLSTLRQRKIRSRKPFAVLYPNLEMLSGDVVLTESMQHWLTGPVAPILLAPLRKQPASGIVKELLAPGLDQLGVVLPYAPLLEMLATRMGKPLVATSANPSGRPLIYEDEVAKKDAWELADAILMHNRPVIVPVDDSVLRLTQLMHTPIWLRRARGMAPLYTQTIEQPLSHGVLAMGADLKGAFTWTHQQQVYVSQYYGDLQQYETQLRYRDGIDHFIKLFRRKPDQVLVDLHPDYFSHREGKQLAEKNNLPVKAIQHHEAHFAAILGEHQLLASTKPVLGVVWDGTGWGTDQHIWGGEFFRFEAGEISRLTHFSYFPVIAGDKMAREPRLSALSILHEIPLAGSVLEQRFSSQEWRIYQQLLKRTTGVQTSSVGRMFDAVACMLGVMDKVEYEGEAPLYLEALARNYFLQHEYALPAVFLAWGPDGKPSPKVLLGAVAQAALDGAPVEEISARFHLTLVAIVRQVAEQAGIDRLAFSGGVFQNEVLVDLLVKVLGKSHQLYFHEQLSPNDENVSFGQLIHFHLTDVWNQPERM